MEMVKAGIRCKEMRLFSDCSCDKQTLTTTTGRGGHSYEIDVCAVLSIEFDGTYVSWNEIAREYSQVTTTYEEFRELFSKDYFRVERCLHGF